MCFGKSLVPPLLVTSTELLLKVLMAVSLFIRCEFIEQLLSSQPHLSGQAYFKRKGSSWLAPLPPPEVFLAGLNAATTPYDSVIASLAARGHSGALHKQAVQAVWVRAGKRQ